MKCVATFSENSLYKIKLAKTRRNVPATMYRGGTPDQGKSETWFSFHGSDKRSTGYL